MVIMEYKKLPIHERIKELRKIHDWTQSNLAEKLGVENKMISYYENKKSIPNAETLVKIAEIFNVSIDYLLFDDAPKLPLERTGRNKLVEQMYDIDKLNEKDIEMITYMISSLITKNKMKELASAN
jgi:transcriptional regulator with XRE-family HTH domain